MDMDMNVDKSIVIIGSGPSGLASAKYALQSGMKPIVLEQRADFGGVWNQQYGYTWNSMTTNLSKHSCSFSDFPWEEDSPIFPPSKLFFNYLRKFAEHFNIVSHIKFNCKVISLKRVHIKERSCYEVKWKENGEEKKQIFPFAILATGIFSKPYIPQFEGLGKFKGTVMHSNVYKKGDDLKGKKVLVIGGSFTGIELSADTSKHTEVTHHCFRAPFWLINHFVRTPQNTGVPFDLFFHRRHYHSQPKLNYQQQLVNSNKFLSTICLPQQEVQSLKVKEQDFSRPVFVAISTTYLEQVKQEKIIPHRTEIKKFTENGVIFKNQPEKEYEVDAVVICTGYHITLDFLDEEIKKDIEYDQRDQKKPFIMFNEVAHPNYPNLFFVGMFKATLIPGCELQARWAIKVFSGEVELASKEQMLKQMDEERMFRSYKPQPQAPHIPLIIYGDEMAKQMGHRLELDKMKEQNFELYQRFIDIPSIQTHLYFTTDSAEEQITNLNKIVESCTIKL